MGYIMNNLILKILLVVFIFINNQLFSITPFWYSDLALDNTGQILDNTVINVKITIEDGTTSFGTEVINSVQTDQLGVFAIIVNATGTFDNVLVTADTRIRTEVQDQLGGSWVVVSVRNMTETDKRGIIRITDWRLEGNSGTNPGANFLGTIDDVDLVLKINSTESGRLNRSKATASYGYQALNSSTGAGNNAFGYQALFNNTSGWSNIAIGEKSLFSNTFRGNHIAIGDSALYNNGIGASDTMHAIRNVAIGSKALWRNTTGYWNTAVGFQTAYYNQTGKSLTAVGTEALMNNTTGDNNTATGTWALYNNTTGYYNSGFGSGALKSNVIGYQNTAVGLSSMYYNNGNNNVSVGFWAMGFNSSGQNNTSVGSQSLYHNSTGSNNSSFGYFSGYSASGRNYSNSTFLGAYADANFNGATNVLAIGYQAVATANNQVRLGNSSISSLYCQGAYAATTTNQPNMFVASNGQIMRSTATTLVKGIQNATATASPINVTETIVNVGAMSSAKVFTSGTTGQIVYVIGQASGANTLNGVNFNNGCTFIFDGTNWVAVSIN